MGMVGPVSEPVSLAASYRLFRWDLVDWSAFPRVIPMWLGMVVVLPFSSGLDIAAIEIGEHSLRRARSMPLLCSMKQMKQMLYRQIPLHRRSESDGRAIYVRHSSCTELRCALPRSLGYFCLMRWMMD